MSFAVSSVLRGKYCITNPGIDNPASYSLDDKTAKK